MAKGKPSAKPQMTPIHISREHWFILRQLALRRSLDRGRRVTMNEVIAELIEKQRREIERELK